MNSLYRFIYIAVCAIAVTLGATQAFAAYDVYITIKGGKVNQRVAVNDDGTFKIPALTPGHYTFALALGGKKGYDVWKSNVSRVKVQFHWDRSSSADARKGVAMQSSSSGDNPMESVSKTTVGHSVSSGGDRPSESVRAMPRSGRKMEDDVVDVTAITPNARGEVALGAADLDGDGMADFVGTIHLEGIAHKHIAGVKYED